MFSLTLFYLKFRFQKGCMVCGRVTITHTHNCQYKQKQKKRHLLLCIFMSWVLYITLLFKSYATVNYFRSSHRIDTHDHSSLIVSAVRLSVAGVECVGHPDNSSFPWGLISTHFYSLCCCDRVVKDEIKSFYAPYEAWFLTEKSFDAFQTRNLHIHMKAESL